MKKLSCLFFSSFVLCTGFGQQSSTLSADPSDALYFKGLSYSSNGLLLKDVSKARNYFRQAAALGNTRAMLSLGVQYSGEQGYLNADSALYWYNEAALKGSKEAWFYLGNLYHFSQGGMIQDFARAYSIYEKGAAAGDVKCITMLGYYHFKGLAGKQSYAKAYSYFVQAAEKGNAMANYYLGLQYRNGYGVQRDEEKARAFLTISSNMGEKQAKKELLTAEGENPVVPLVPPQTILQNGNSKYQKLKHNLSQGSIKGTYKGYALTYDWSGNNIIGISPLEVTLQSTGSNITGTWKERDNETDILAYVTDSALLFENTEYNKVDHYSEFKGGEVWQLHNAIFNLLQGPDSVYISGNIQLYSDSRKEPGKPLYIHLARVATESEKLVLNKQVISLACNNPFNNNLVVTFTIPTTTPATLRVLDQRGEVIYSESAGVLEGGTYKRVINIPGQISNGSYILEILTNKDKKAKVIVKQ